MNIFQIWIGEKIPEHVMMCYRQMAKFHRDGDNYLFFTDRLRDDLPKCYDQINIDEYLQSSCVPTRYYMTVCGLMKTKYNIATLADLLRFIILSDSGKSGWSYIDSDILMVRDPRYMLTPLSSMTLYQVSSDDFSCVGVLTNPIGDCQFMRKVTDKCCDIIKEQITLGKRVNVKDLMFAMDDLRKTDFSGGITLRDRNAFFKIGYSAMCNRIKNGSLQQKDLDAIANDKTVLGVHLWRPESMDRVKADILDVFASQFINCVN